MAAKYIFPSMNPGGVELARVSVGAATDSPDVAFTTSTGSLVLFKVPLGTLVHDLEVRKITAFTSGTPAFTIGDTDVDGYMAALSLVATDASFIMKSAKGWVLSSAGQPSPAYGGGKYYGSDETYDTDGYASIVLSVSGAAPTAGLAEVYLLYSLRQSHVK